MAGTESERRFRLIVFGILGLLAVGVVGYSLLQPEDEPTPEDRRANAELACQRFISDAVDPLDVDFRELGSARVVENGQSFTVTDRMVIRGDLTPFECEVVRNGDRWRLVNIDTP